MWVLPLQGGMRWGYIAPVLSLSAVGSPLSMEIMELGWDGEWFYCAPEGTSPISTGIFPAPCRLPDMLCARIAWGTLGGFVTHPHIGV